MKVKICGLNPLRDIKLCVDLGVHFLGFVFFDKSPRNVKLSDIKTISNYNRKNSSFVAVTVDPKDEFIKKNRVGNFDFIQLHGSETKERVIEIKNMGFKIIKAIKVKEEKDIGVYKHFEDVADLILFDSNSMERSKSIPKDLLSKIPKGDKFGLAGALNSKNILEYSKLGLNFFDLSSGLEKENLTGYKDHLKIKSFMSKIDML